MGRSAVLEEHAQEDTPQETHLSSPAESPSQKSKSAYLTKALETVMPDFSGQIYQSALDEPTPVDFSSLVICGLCFAVCILSQHLKIFCCLLGMAHGADMGMAPGIDIGH